MKVRAKEYGQYKGRMYEPGQEFEIEDGTYPLHAVDDQSRPILKDGKPVVSGTHSHLEHWMEKVEEVSEKPQSFMGRVFHGDK